MTNRLGRKQETIEAGGRRRRNADTHRFACIEACLSSSRPPHLLALALCWRRWRPQSGDGHQNFQGHLTRHRDLGNLLRDINSLLCLAPNCATTKRSHEQCELATAWSRWVPIPVQSAGLEQPSLTAAHRDRREYEIFRVGRVTIRPGAA
jgi:hypothetical protein